MEKEYKRPDWDRYFMAIASVISTRASCKHVRAGVILTLDHRIIGTGYNGPLAGEPNCSESSQGCMKEKKRLEYHSSLGSGECVGIHAELNAINHRTQFKIDGFTLYTTIFPCMPCAKTLASVGLKKVVFKNYYAFNEKGPVEDLFKRRKIETSRLCLSPLEILDILIGQKPVDFDAFSKEEREQALSLLGPLNY